MPSIDISTSFWPAAAFRGFLAVYALPLYTTHKKPAAELGPTVGSLPTLIYESRNFLGVEEFQRPAGSQSFAFAPGCNGGRRTIPSFLEPIELSARADVY
ncbi:protein of unknown function [Bradyrhizobium vignae]|uniref:Uncharacterized protein n=1 Tax=Bradyrhizobium vignae TaxID=1549949 RepID=A0A2U3PUH5_9BRAD|nr:protein of unknown function [Bradyrhizobium vignae]